MTCTYCEHCVAIRRRLDELLERVGKRYGRLGGAPYPVRDIYPEGEICPKNEANSGPLY